MDSPPSSGPMARIVSLPADDAVLKLEIKQIILSACERDESADTIGDDDILIGDGSTLALDSLDSLQAAVAISKRFGIRIQDSKHARRVMRSVNTLAAYIRAQH